MMRVFCVFWSCFADALEELERMKTEDLQAPIGDEHGHSAYYQGSEISFTKPRRRFLLMLVGAAAGW